jgi:hypothetical protein
MVGLTREQRAQRNDAARQEAKQGQEFGGTAYADIQQQVDAQNEMDERAPDRRPATIVNHETQEAAPDNRQFAGDMGKALNQMAGRAAITENTDPHPHITAAENPAGAGSTQGDGDEVVILRGYQPNEGDKIPAGTVTRLPSKEARRLSNIGAAKFTDA